MTLNGKYIIDNTKDSIVLYNIVNTSIIDRNNIMVDYCNIVESILDLAKRFCLGNIDTDINKFIEDIIFKYFGTMLNQVTIDDIVISINKILEYFILTIYSLGISSYLLYVRSINNRGIVIDTYDCKL